MVDLYESAIAGAFMYRFGFFDGEKGLGGVNLLLNAQNPLDEMLGDLIGEVEGNSQEASRYFLVEFKRDLLGGQKWFC